MNKEQKICALIAVRMKSKRLPKKALVDIEGYTAIERVVNNLKPSKYIDEIILATSTNMQDDPIENIAKRKNILIFRGDEDNVVKRFIDAAEKFNADIVVRVTGDCPLISYEIADFLIENHLKSGADYTGIELDSVPIGSFSEVFNLSALKKLMALNVDLNYSEYMTFYFRNNPEYFSLNIVPGPKEFYRPSYSLTLDYPEDLEVLRNLYKHLGSYSEAIPLQKAIAYLDQNPDISIKNRTMEIKWRDDKKFLEELIKLTKIKSNYST